MATEKDLAVVIVSYNSAHWLGPCLRTLLEHADGVTIEVVVADNSSTDRSQALVRDEFPTVRLISGPNRGFAAANNRAIASCDSRYVLFLNPDTEILQGSLRELVDALDARPRVGLAGVRQQNADGLLQPTIRRFPNALRGFGEALASERLRVRGRWFGERVLDPKRYELETPIDWTSGSFMIARQEALATSGLLDERFFLYSEETDLCYRIKRAGWEIVHLPLMTILHHADKDGLDPRLESQNAFSKLQYAGKHFSAAHRALFWTALCVRYGLRASIAGSSANARARRLASRKALRTVLGWDPPPFGPVLPASPRDSAEPRPTQSTRTFVRDHGGSSPPGGIDVSPQENRPLGSPDAVRGGRL